MLDLDTALDLLNKYGYTSIQVHPFVYQDGDTIGLCYTYVDEDYGLLERIKIFNNAEEFEEFLKMYNWVQTNGKLHHVRMILDNYESINPKTMFLRNEKIMVEGEDMRYIGIDIGGTKCAITLGNEQGVVLKKKYFETTTVSETIDNIFSAVKEVGPCDAIGISCGGPLDSKSGVILSPPNLPGWDDIHIVEMLTKEFCVPVFLKNDADACALAEWKFGAGKGTKNMIFCTFGTGLGAGLILNENLYMGTCDMAGEIGHMRLSEYGPVGYGKSGSFEGFCSGGGIAQIGRFLAREFFQQGKIPSFCKNTDELGAITAKRIAECAKAGAEDAKEVYRICGKMLGKGLAVLIDLLNPEKIVLGSVFVRSSELLVDEMYKVLMQECLPHALKVCEIVPAALGESLGDIAALSVAIDGLKLSRME